MAVNTYYVNTGVDDWYTSTVAGTIYTSVTLSAGNNKVIFPNDSTVAYANVTTSGIGTDDISAASVIFDESNYTASRGLSKTYNLWMHTGASWVVIQAYTYGRSAVTRTKVLNATQIGYINKSGFTRFGWTVSGTVSSGQFKSLLIKAYETSQAVACRMSVTHAPAPTYSPQVIIVKT